MIIAFVVLLFLLACGMPIGFALIAASLSYMMLTGGIPLALITQSMALSVDSFTILAVPLFILAGNLMNTGGVTRRVFQLANALVGHFRGGLGHVNILASLIFSGMTGAATADAAGLGTLEIKAMRDEGYDAEFAAALTAASATIGPIIPPSIPFVIYGVLANASIGALFLGGIIPGVLMGILLMVWTSIYAWRRNYPRRPRASVGEIWRAIKESFLPMQCPVIILGGIWGGIFTPTEAASVAVVYALILGLMVYKELRLADLPRIITATLSTTSTVCFIVAGATLFAWIMAREQVPQQIGTYLLSLTQDRYTLLLILNLFLLAVGCFMEAIAAMTILVPILLPIIVSVGIDPVHFGIVMTLNLMIGLLTPPVGLILYIVSKIADISFAAMVRAVAPFLVPLLIALLLITLVPGFVLWLPRALL